MTVLTLSLGLLLCATLCFAAAEWLSERPLCMCRRCERARAEAAERPHR
jgi:hypothetical protein